MFWVSQQSLFKQKKSLLHFWSLKSFCKMINFSTFFQLQYYFLKFCKEDEIPFETVHRSDWNLTAITTVLKKHCYITVDRAAQLNNTSTYRIAMKNTQLIGQSNEISSVTYSIENSATFLNIESFKEEPLVHILYSRLKDYKKSLQEFQLKKQCKKNFKKF